MKKLLLSAVVLLISSAIFAQDKTEVYKLAPTFPIFSVSGLNSNGVCEIDQGHHSVYFNNYLVMHLEALTDLTLKITQNDSDNFFVEVIATTATKADAVEIKFNANNKALQNLKKSWLNTPKKAWYEVTEDAECSFDQRVQVQNLEVSVH